MSGAYPDDLSVLSFNGQMQGCLQVDVLQIQLGSTSSDEKLGNFHVIVKCGQMKGRVSVVFLLIHDPRSRKLRQQHTHGTADQTKTKKWTREKKTW